MKVMMEDTSTVVDQSDVRGATTPMLTQEQHSNVAATSPERQQQLEVKARELFNQLTLPLKQQGTTVATSGGHSGVGQQFSTLPCKLKVHIKISPSESSKTKNSKETLNLLANRSKSTSQEDDEEVVVAEIIEESSPSPES